MSYRAGIIGTGGIAGMGILGFHEQEKIGVEKFEASHAGGYDATEDIELVAVADLDEDKLARFGEAWNIPSERQYVGHDSMLENEDLDVVSICTPTYFHHEHVVAAAESPASPDVIWCEKPIASSVTQAHQMQSVCVETDTELVINHSFRFEPKIQQLRSLLADDIIGDVKSVTAQFRRELLRNSTHLLDTLVFLLDTRASSVYGYVNGKNDAVEALDGDRTVDDSGGGGMVVMDDGTIAMIDCTLAREISSMNLSFIGTNGKLVINNDDGEWRYWSLDNGTHVEKPLPDLDGTWTWDEDYTASFAHAANHISDLLAGDAVNLSTGDSATRSLEIIAGFYISHYTGSRVSVPLDRPLRDVTISSW